MRRIREHLTFANVMSCLAVFIALGGSSYAAVQLKKNSVRSQHIRDRAVANRDLKDNSVDGRKVADGSLAAGDFAPGALPGPGPAGPAGPPGERGPAGAQGERGPTGTVDTSNFYDKATSDDRFLGRTAKAADSNLLDGTDGNGFSRGAQARSFVFAQAVSPGFNSSWVGDGDRWAVQYSCPSGTPSSSLGTVRFRHTGATPEINLFSDNGSADPQHFVLTPASPERAEPASNGAGGEAITFDAQGWSPSGTMVHARVITKNRANDCHFQIYATQMTFSFGMPALSP